MQGENTSEPSVVSKAEYMIREERNRYTGLIEYVVYRLSQFLCYSTIEEATVDFPLAKIERMNNGV
jgi:hypothetical protein